MNARHIPYVHRSVFVYQLIRQLVNRYLVADRVGLFRQRGIVYRNTVLSDRQFRAILYVTEFDVSVRLRFGEFHGYFSVVLHLFLSKEYVIRYLKLFPCNRHSRQIIPLYRHFQRMVSDKMKSQAVGSMIVTKVNYKLRRRGKCTIFVRHFHREINHVRGFVRHFRFTSIKDKVIFLKRGVIWKAYIIFRKRDIPERLIVHR